MSDRQLDKQEREQLEALAESDYTGSEVAKALLKFYG